MDNDENDILRDLRMKIDKTPIEHMLLRYQLTLSIISSILVDESKQHMSSEQAINEIRECMQDNL